MTAASFAVPPIRAELIQTAAKHALEAINGALDMKIHRITVNSSMVSRAIVALHRDGRIR